MADIRGSSGPSVGVSSLAWPAGTVAGDLGVLWDVDGDRPPPGWRQVWSDVWRKRLTAGDIASPMPTSGAVSALVVLSLAGGVGSFRQSKYVKLKAGSVGVWLGWQSPHQGSTALASATYQRGSTVIDPSDNWRHAVWARAVGSADYYEPGSVSRHAELVALEVLPLAAPSAPLWLSPASGASVDRTQPQALSFAHVSQAAAPMDLCRVEVRVAAGTWQHVNSSGTLVASAQDLVQSGATGTVQLAANQLTANTTYEMRVYTHDDGGWSPVSGTLSIVARTPPTVAPTLTTALNDLTPAVTWATTPGVGSQVSWEARISPVGAGPEGFLPGWSSGVQPGTATSWTPSVPSELPANGGSYVAWLRVSDSSLRSAWASSTSRVVSWTPPTAPAALTVTDEWPLTLTATGVPALSVALEWEWQDEDGAWHPLATTDGPASTEAIRNPLAPYGVARVYRVRALGMVEGVRVSSSWVTSSAVASTDPGAYLVSEDGREWLAIDTWDAGSPTPIQGHAVSSGFGSPVQRVDRTQVAGWSGWTVARTEGLPAATALWDWLTGRERMWLRPNPEAIQFGEGGPLADEPAILITITGFGEPDRLTRRNWRTRLIRFDWTTQGA